MKKTKNLQGSALQVELARQVRGSWGGLDPRTRIVPDRRKKADRLACRSKGRRCAEAF